MKVTITGSLGNISQPLAKQLLQAGHTVTIISSDPNKKAAIEALGAIASIGALGDVAFVTSAFTGADAVYTMIPPFFGASNYREYVANAGRIYAQAIASAGIKKVVNLSSIGAHLESGTGPIAGLHDAEIALNQLENVAIKHVRAPFFYINFYNDIPLIKHQGIMGANYPASTRLVMVHPADIAAAVAEELQQNFTGKSIRYLVSDDRTVGESVAVLANAISKPSLPWVEFTDEQSENGMLQAGLPPVMATIFTEMGAALRKGILWEDYDKNKPAQHAAHSLEMFAQEFAARFAAE
ncbi:Uncharacterized conserved protein YbjT, contains NAD(P)-binding and DUF2867 domains [Filimonas lacunae]|uniref:Uncharacterized conserved protein YbjT, contains NAD(P)-binding and DUF2867 domains n=1 Tax=Filimonas lacunae TaxID=477680 RepID=A0A173MEQ6_9BACT|nr:NAD(P)H-binding protein [Filimonas lacunae]BAV05911.1 NmrA family protein [Filimonas lacunae]SIT34526.1 Uncharacterized conserved protein YbjT, contains NAD(P)-binding and DUF2867 domains [Filimonas lacunae]